MGLVTADPKTGQTMEARKSNEIEAIGVPMIGVLLLWIMIMMGAAPLLNAVMEEKTLRIAEVLLGCATLRDHARQAAGQRGGPPSPARPFTSAAHSSPSSSWVPSASSRFTFCPGF